MSDSLPTLKLPSATRERRAGAIGFKELLSFVRFVERHDAAPRIALDLEHASFAHPAGMAPIVAYIRHLYAKGVVVDVYLPRDDFHADYYRKAGWTDGIEGLRPKYRRGRPTDTFIPLSAYEKYEELNPIINDAIRHFTRSTDLGKGVLEGLEWALNEVADNVLIHAGNAVGYLQLSQQPSRGTIEFVVVDCGRGILDSLREGHPNLRTDEEALFLAVEKGVTRDTSIGQGNGLAGTWRIAVAARGSANLYSGNALLRYRQPAAEGKRSPIESTGVESAPHFPGTVVTITLPTRQTLDVASALWGNRPVSNLENEYLTDTGSGIHFRVANEASGFGNRPSARPLRTTVENLLRQFPNQAVEIDFADVNLVSASFADEFVARMAKQVGITTFFQRVRLVNMNDIVRRTLDAVLEQRMRT